MKLYISADVEGVTGVTHFDETELHKQDSKVHLEQMTAEVAAACEGALEAGAKEIWVKDAHDTGRNVLASKLPREVRLIRGWSGHPFMMLQELNETFHAVALIGYHARAGTSVSPLAHTLTGKIAHVKLNGIFASEFLIHAYAASSLRVPTIFVSGDKGLCEEVAQLNPHIGTVAVKEGVGGSTVSIHPSLATEQIKQGVKKALAGDVSRCLLDMPERFSLEVRYKDHPRAYLHGFFPGAKQEDAFTVRFESASYYEVMRFLLFA